MSKIMRIPEPKTQLLMIINMLESIDDKINKCYVRLGKLINIKFRLNAIRERLQQQIDAETPPSGVIIGVTEPAVVDMTVLEEFH